MTEPAIRAALDVAAKCLCICDGECFETQRGMMHGPCERPRHSAAAAAAIAAFLWHIRDASEGGAFTIDAGHPVTLGSTLELGTLAAAVEQAAREGGG